jgi:hypothetical protein
MLKNFSQFLTEGSEVKQVRIFCDLDGVLVDFNRGFKRIEANKDELSPTEYEEKYGAEKMWEMVDDAGDSFWANLKWMKDGRELWDYLSQFDPIILSSPSRSKHSIHGKMKWINRNLGLSQPKPTTSSKKWDPESRIILSSYKYKFAKSKDDILIDDTKAKIKDWTEAGGTGILHNDATDTIRVMEEILSNKD